MARLGSKTPDLAQLMPFIMRTWMYSSGVMFSITVMLADKPSWIADTLRYNPAAIYMDLIRYALIRRIRLRRICPPHVWVGRPVLGGLHGCRWASCTSGRLRSGTAVADDKNETRIPTVIADEVHIVYRVNGVPRRQGRCHSGAQPDREQATRGNHAVSARSTPCAE